MEYFRKPSISYCIGNNSSSGEGRTMYSAGTDYQETIKRAFELSRPSGNYTTK
jgi:hypothetical protein